MKKLLAGMLVAVLLLSCVVRYSVYAVEMPIFSVSDANGKAGDEITVSVSLINNPGIIGLLVKIEYDSDVLELKDAVVKDFAEASFGPITKKPFLISWSDSIHGDIASDGIIAELTFVIKADAPVGKTSVTLSYDPDDVFNSDWDNVTFDIINSNVTVEPTEEAKPTATPTAEPTEEAKPTATPTAEPTEEAKPTATPPAEPTEEAKPTATPTAEPTEEAKPTATPTAEPTEEAKPTATPTAEPTEEAKPTATPTVEPTEEAELTATPTEAMGVVDENTPITDDESDIVIFIIGMFITLGSIGVLTWEKQEQNQSCNNSK